MNRTATRPADFTGYLPKAGSGAWHAIAFFARRPDEELTTADAAAKLAVEPKTVTTLLAHAVSAGYLTSVLTLLPSGTRRAHTAVYRAGPRLADVLPHMHQIDRSVPARPLMD